MRLNEPKLSSVRQATARATAAAAVTMTKMARQPMWSTSSPDRVGPTVGANPMMSPTTPMALPRFSRGNTSSTTLDTMGMIAPVATACRTRPSSSAGKAGETAATRLPVAKSDSPPM